MTDRKSRILVLDDDVFMLRLITRMLENAGYHEIITHSNGRTALEEFAKTATAPALVLLDLNMPEMDGIEFLRHLVERDYTGSLILISGEDERMLQTAERLVRAHRIPLLGQLHKPASAAMLSDLLGKWQTARTPGTPSARKVYSAKDVLTAIREQQLVNHYQPKVSVASGEVIGVETLVRWQHPDDGLVLPSQFISVAESNGLIDDLARVVLTGALTQARDWQQAGLALRTAINISMDNLVSLDFPDYIAGLAAEAGVPPQDIILEVTESRLMRDLRAPLEILTRLKLKRFRLSIDDFGTGHSSLAQLRDIPFDELKIDQGFVHQAAANSTLRAMYDASLGLARQLGMEVVAEGVEDRDDWDLLRETGCDHAQGYYIARPMPATGLAGWIKTWQTQARYRLSPETPS